MFDAGIPAQMYVLVSMDGHGRLLLEASGGKYVDMGDVLFLVLDMVLLNLSLWSTYVETYFVPIY